MTSKTSTTDVTPKHVRHLRDKTDHSARSHHARHAITAARGAGAIPPDLLQALRENHRLLREVAACYRMPRAHSQNGAPIIAASPIIACPDDVVMLLGDEMSTLVQEQLRVLLIDTRGGVLGCEVIYQGTIHSISIRAAEVLRPAILANAPAIIVVHNHPSGDPDPSLEDARATEHLSRAGDAVDVQVLDHIVIGKAGRYVSMKERGVIRLSTNTDATAA